MQLLCMMLTMFLYNVNYVFFGTNKHFLIPDIPLSVFMLILTMLFPRETTRTLS